MRAYVRSSYLRVTFTRDEWNMWLRGAPGPAAPSMPTARGFFTYNTCDGSLVDVSPGGWWDDDAVAAFSQDLQWWGESRMREGRVSRWPKGMRAAPTGRRGSCRSSTTGRFKRCH